MRSASADSWKIGRREVGDGLLIVVAKNDRQRAHRSRQGAGRRGARPGGAADHRPSRSARRFKAGDFAGGLDAGDRRARWRASSGEGLPAPAGAGAQRGARRRLRLAGPGDVLLRRRAGASAAVLIERAGPQARLAGSPAAAAGALAWLFSASLLIAGVAGAGGAVAGRRAGHRRAARGVGRGGRRRRAGHLGWRRRRRLWRWRWRRRRRLQLAAAAAISAAAAPRETGDEHR